MWAKQNTYASQTRPGAAGCGYSQHHIIVAHSELWDRLTIAAPCSKVLALGFLELCRLGVTEPRNLSVYESKRVRRGEAQPPAAAPG